MLFVCDMGDLCQAARHCQNLDVRVLLSGIKYTTLNKIETQRAIDLVIFDKKFKQDEIEKFLNNRVANKSETCGIVTLEGNGEQPMTPVEVNNETICNHVVLGGTFDRLHLAHKLLLSEAALRSKAKVTVGVTEGNMLYGKIVCRIKKRISFNVQHCLCFFFLNKMLSGKILWELIDPIEKRMSEVKHFLTDICPELDINIVPITDPFGPTKDDPTMDMIVVSKETVKGGHKVNEGR